MRDAITERRQNLGIERSTAAFLHFLHHNVVVLQYQIAHGSDLFASQSEGVIAKGGIEGSNTTGKTEPAGQEALYHILGLTLVRFHAG